MAEQEYIIEWRPVVGYEEDYEISNTGLLRKSSPDALGRQLGYIFKSGPRQMGYIKYTLSAKDGSRLTLASHALVMAAFVGPRPRGLQINHIDGNKANNKLSNLEYVTPSRNVTHAVEIGLHPTGDRSGSRRHPERLPRGESHLRSKFTNTDIVVVRRMYEIGVTQVEIAREFGVHLSTIQRIISRETWAHVA